MWMEFIYSRSQNSNIWDVFSMDQVQKELNVVRRWGLGGGLGMLESCMKHCLYLILHIAVRMLWKEKSRIRAVKMDKFRGLLGIRWMEKVSNARITCRVDERIVEGFLWWFSHVERTENDRITKRVYLGECTDIS